MRNSILTMSVIGISSLILTLGVHPAVAAERTPTAPAVSSDAAWMPPESADDHFPVPDDPDAPLGDDALTEDVESGGDVQAGRAPAGTTAGAPGLGELPWFTFQEFELSADATAQVNIANGNLLLKANDLAIAGPGSPLRHDRFYNGLSTEAGSFGGGWASNNGVTDVYFEYSGRRVFHGPNGLTVAFEEQPDGSWKAPAGYNFTLETVVAPRAA